MLFIVQIYYLSLIDKAWNNALDNNRAAKNTIIFSFIDHRYFVYVKQISHTGGSIFDVKTIVQICIFFSIPRIRWQC